MYTRSCVIVVLLLASLPAEADLFRCVNDRGAVEFSDKPCIGAKSVESVKIQDNRISGSRGASVAPGSQNPNIATLDTAVQGALVRKDFQRAKGLAVTGKHWSMIAAAEKQEEARRRAQEHHELIQKSLTTQPWSRKSAF